MHENHKEIWCYEENDQYVQQIRQLRSFPRNQTFAERDLIYFLLQQPHCKLSRKLKMDWIGPLKIKAAFDSLIIYLQIGMVNYYPSLEQYTYID